MLLICPVGPLSTTGTTAAHILAWSIKTPTNQPQAVLCSGVIGGVLPKH